jgi:hypothetical protein
MILKSPFKEWKNEAQTAFEKEVSAINTRQSALGVGYDSSIITYFAQAFEKSLIDYITRCANAIQNKNAFPVERYLFYKQVTSNLGELRVHHVTFLFNALTNKGMGDSIVMVEERMLTVWKNAEQRLMEYKGGWVGLPRRRFETLNLWLAFIGFLAALITAIGVLVSGMSGFVTWVSGLNLSPPY